MDRPIDRRAFVRAGAALGATLLLPSWVQAQREPDDRLPEGFDRPDERGEVWARIEWSGITPYCNVPRSIRQRNTDGTGPGPSDGLCVIASQVTDGRHQKLVRDMERLWQTAKSRPGGYWPERMKKLAHEICPDIPFVSYEERETKWMEAVLKQGIPIGSTYGTGRGYRYQQIAHMVSLVHYGTPRGIAAVIDNNFPAFVAFMPIAEYNRRFVLGQQYGWAFYWNVPLRPSPLPDLSHGSSLEGPALALGMAVGASAGVGLYLAARSRAQTL